MPPGESFSGGPRVGLTLLTRGWGSRNNLKGKASILTFSQSRVSCIWVQPTLVKQLLLGNRGLANGLLKLRKRRGDETEACVSRTQRLQLDWQAPESKNPGFSLETRETSLILMGWKVPGSREEGGTVTPAALSELTALLVRHTQKSPVGIREQVGLIITANMLAVCRCFKSIK